MAERHLTQGRPGRTSVARQSCRATPAAVNGHVDLDYMRDIAEVTAADLDGDGQVRSVDRLSDGHHYRVEFDETWAAGYGEMCSLGDGLYVYVIDANLHQPYVMRINGDDTLRIRIASEGCGEFAPAHGEPVNVDGPGALIIVEPAGMPPSEAVLDGRQRAAHIYAHKAALSRLYDRGRQGLPGVVQAFLDGSLQRPVVRWVPLTSALLRCLDDLQTCDQEGTTRWLYFHSKAIEIFCLAFKALEDEDSFGATETSATRTRGVLKAQKILLRRFVSPPSLDELATEVGISRTSLSTGFRQILGQSVFDYILDLRLQHALALLSQRGASVTQVAYAVGYNHASSFSVAMQRRFGASPKELRRRATLPAL
jgi:AraC family transcriptional activator of pyochelin receptor